MQLLAEYPTPGDGITAPGRVILVERDHPYHPFVTWWQNLQSGGKCWGHYFDNETEAREDFTSRCQRGY